MACGALFARHARVLGRLQDLAPADDPVQGLDHNGVDLPKAVGRRVRELRARLGISQEELAARADLHRNYVGSVERGERDIGITALGSLAAALDVSLQEFFRTFRSAPRR